MPSAPNPLPAGGIVLVGVAGLGLGCALSGMWHAADSSAGSSDGGAGDAGADQPRRTNLLSADDAGSAPVQAEPEPESAHQQRQQIDRQQRIILALRTMVASRELTGQAAAAAPAGGAAAGDSGGTVSVVTQRVDEASLLVDNQDEWVTIGKGLLLYVSFATGADLAAVQRAAKVLLGLPLCTRSGQWGDGASAASYLKICAAQAAAGEPLLELLIVPQAALCGRPSKGQTLTYLDQVEKEPGRELFRQFVAALSALVAEAVAPPPNAAEVAAASKAASKAKQARTKQSALQPPTELFHTTEYSAWNGRGIPTQDAAGEAVTKSARKKLEKRMKAAKGKYERAQTAGSGATGAPVPPPAVESAAADTEEETQADTVKCGTFGNRQGLRVTATGGPFCHTFRL